MFLEWLRPRSTEAKQKLPMTHNVANQTSSPRHQSSPPNGWLVQPNAGPWEKVPWWMFWPQGARRKSWRLDRSGSMWLPCWEYQHEAFVAREALENYCAPRIFTGDAEQGSPATQAPDTHRHRPAGNGMAGSLHRGRVHL